MREDTELSGIVLKTGNLGEYDKRMVVLTDSRGKITVFARGVRRTHSRYLPACEPFVFGTFKLIEGREAYSFLSVEVKDYFEPLRTDITASCMGMYFLEVADYYTRENNDELLMMKLLYVSLKALAKGTIEPALIRCVYEMKSIMINGEFPGIVPGMKLSDTAAYTIEYIMKADPARLYTFRVKDEVLRELISASSYYTGRYLTGQFSSLRILDSL